MNLHLNAKLEYLQGAWSKMLHTARLKGKDNLNSIDIEKFIIDAAWAVHLTPQTIFSPSPWTAVSPISGRPECNKMQVPMIGQ